MKKIISVIICVIMVLSLLCTAVFATDSEKSEALQSAERLYELGLFKGVGTNADGTINFSLDRPATRVEALVMLIRLLGKESAATGSDWESPFTDIPDWAKNYVGYAYQNGITKGVSDTKFGSGDASAQMYITFVLRALGYSDSEGDFKWDEPEKLAYQIKLLDNDAHIDSFTRGDCAIVSETALGIHLKGSYYLLSDVLISEGALNLIAYSALKQYSDFERYDRAENQILFDREFREMTAVLAEQSGGQGVSSAWSGYVKNEETGDYVEINCEIEFFDYTITKSTEKEGYEWRSVSVKAKPSVGWLKCVDGIQVFFTDYNNFQLPAITYNVTSSNTSEDKSYNKTEFSFVCAGNGISQMMTVTGDNGYKAEYPGDSFEASFERTMNIISDIEGDGLNAKLVEIVYTYSVLVPEGYDGAIFGIGYSDPFLGDPSGIYKNNMLSNEWMLFRLD